MEESIKTIISSSWVAATFGLNALGYLIKNHTKLSNNLIPWVMAGVGAGTGYGLIEQTPGGAIAGMVLGLAAVGVHNLYKVSKAKGDTNGR